MSNISTAEHPKKKIDVTVNGTTKTMAYVEMGDGDPIVFLHGNPTSSYLWRNIIPHLKDQGRCIAPDLIGMGDSDKLDNPGPDSYRFVEHRQWLDAVFDALGVSSNITLVIHDWGSALGFDWANRHRDAVKGIVYMEGIVKPMTWEEWPDAATEIFQGFRSPAGEDMVLDKNVFVEAVLPGSVLRGLTEEEMAVYRRPFANTGEDRRPTLTWPRQIPLAGEPADVIEIVEAYGKWLSEADVPKLFVNAEPGAITTGAMRDFCRSWPNQTEITVPGNHFIQEDSPHEIGAAASEFVKKISG
ncbi:MAG: haloalkane dehalogenase [Candidatus Phaeomarinobacter sp.]